eukprot:s172_g36.t1
MPSMTGFGMQSMPPSPTNAMPSAAAQGLNMATAAPTGPGPCGMTGCPQLTATSVLRNLDNTALPPPTPNVQSAFEMLGKTPVVAPTHERVDRDDVMMKALVAAISGDKKSLPPWNGSVETLRSWLRQLSLWELDNNLPKSRWGLKLLQSFHEGTAPRRIAEAIDLATLTSEAGYSAILSSLMAKYAPYLEASGPAAVENFFYSNERAKNESFSTYVAAKEIALQEMESHLGEKLPPRIAGRILLRHAGLNDFQRESLAVKYNALLTFDQAAAALRPLDRPEALVSKVSKTYMTSAQADNEALDDEQNDEDDDELQPAEDEFSGPESDGHGNFTYMLFDPEQEYDEDEANFVWAYNSAYKDVRKELQARRKGRQFYKPKTGVAKKGKNKGSQHSGKGKGSSSSNPRSGQGRGQGHRGTPEELMARTRCFSCGQLGHISKECPKRAESSANFFVCQGSSGNQNKIYVNISEAKEKKFSVFAGVQTSGNEAVVDTAAEEAVIGSAAMAKLRQCLEGYGLQPAPAPGATVTCAGIGGSAKILGIYDVPVGVARTNGLIRVTEISDEGSFCTPFLLPISYIELVGATVDVSRELFTLRNGNSTPMRRSPSGHRTISVLEFSGKWNLPTQLLDELKVDGKNPSHLSQPKPSIPTKFAQKPGVAVWLKTAQHQLQYMGTLSPRKTLVHPKEIFPPSLLEMLDKSRWTVIDSCDVQSATCAPPLSIHDSWLINQQRQLPFWGGDVFFQQFSLSSTPAVGIFGTVDDVAHAQFHVQSPGDPSPLSDRDVHATVMHREASMQPQPAQQLAPMQVQDQRGLERVASVSDAAVKVSAVSFDDAAMQKRVTQWIADQDKEMPDPVPKKKSPPEKLLMAWRRMVLATIRLYMEIMLQTVTDYLTSRNRGTIAKLPKAKSKDKAVVDQKKTAKVRRGIGQPLPRSKACKDWPKEPLDCAHEEDQLRQRGSKDSYWWTCLQCGSRWQRVEWEPDHEVNTASTKIQAKPDHLGRRGNGTLNAVSNGSTDALRRENDSGTYAVRRTIADDPGTPNEPLSKSNAASSTRDLCCDLNGRQCSSERRGVRSDELDSRSTDGYDGEAASPQADSDGKRGATNAAKIQVQGTVVTKHTGGGSPRDPHIGGRHTEGCHSGLYHGDSLKSQKSPTCKASGSKTNSIAKPLAQATKMAVFATVLVCSQFPQAEQRISTLLGSPEEHYSTEAIPGINTLKFPLTASTSELARTDFDGEPKTIDKQQRQHVSFALRNYLDHIGEIYSPPRATAMSQGEGLRGKIALDLTTGWNFCRAEHRQKAVKLVKTHKPAVLLLSPPCGPFSPLRNLSNDIVEGELYMNFAISLAMLQVSEGRGFILEQPKNAKSWKLPKMLELLDHPDVYQIRVDMCQFGLRAQAGPCKGELVQKPTLLATNIAEMAHYVQKTCNKSHQHGMLVGG